jgi:hypothetical protein
MMHPLLCRQKNEDNRSLSDLHRVLRRYIAVPTAVTIKLELTDW